MAPTLLGNIKQYKPVPVLRETVCFQIFVFYFFFIHFAYALIRRYADFCVHSATQTSVVQTLDTNAAFPINIPSTPTWKSLEIVIAITITQWYYVSKRLLRVYNI